MVEFYLKKAQALLANQTFLDVLGNLKKGFRDKKAGYRNGKPVTPFGQILMEMNVKLKHVDRRAIFKSLLLKIQSNTSSVEECIRRISKRAELVPAIFEELYLAEEELTTRLLQRQPRNLK